MNEIPPETRRVQSLLTSLIIISLVILGLVLAIAAYPTVLKPILAPATPPLPTTRPTVTGTLVPTPTLTPTSTFTPRPTLTPSITPTPTESLTPTLTPTSPGPPTLTPAQPGQAAYYRLGDWNEDRANLAIELMKDYPNTLVERLRGSDNRGYYDAFNYAVLAAQEGLLRFPDAQQAAKWRIDLAYNLAQLNDPRAGQVYADILTQALNHNEVDLNGLQNWFKAWETRVQLNRIELTPPQPYLSSNILEIHGPGSAFIWLLETPSGFQSYLLDSNFDFIKSPDMRLIVSDLNGDGLEDAAIYNAAPQDNTLSSPRVFDLSKPPATELFFRPSDAPFNPGMEYTNNWRPVKNSQGGNDLSLNLRLFPACPIDIRQTYAWDKNYFSQAQSQFSVQPSLDALYTCRFIVEQAASTWGPAAAAQIIEQLLPNWPPPSDENGKPYPADAKDEWRYRLGVYQALTGDADQAIQTLTELAQKPVTSASRWVQPAKDFLSVYKTPADLYQACSASQFCDPNQAIDFLVNRCGGEKPCLPSDQNPVQFLNQHGVLLRSSGYFDFDDDGVKERWFTVQPHPLEKLSLWVLAQTKTGVRAIPVGQLQGDQPTLQVINKDQKPPVIWIDDGLFITFGRDSDTADPYIQRVSPQLEYPDRFREGVDKARLSLFAGQDPKLVLLRLQGLEKDPGLLCQHYYTCDEYYFLLGLTNELLGNEQAAIQAYLTLWREYSRSPFATLARLKLESTLVQPTAVPTATLTAFPTGLLTPGTPAPTPTLNPQATATPPGLTPPPATSTIYPYPLPGYTPYPTATELTYPTP